MVLYIKLTTDCGQDIQLQYDILPNFPFVLN